MVAGALLYASQTETLEFCKAVYDPEMLKLDR